MSHYDYDPPKEMARLLRECAEAAHDGDRHHLPETVQFIYCSASRCLRARRTLQWLAALEDTPDA